MPSLNVLYQANQYHVGESSGCLLVGLKPGSVSFVVKELRNATPLDASDAEALYEELQAVGREYGCRHYRVVAYGGYTPEALAFELHGLTVCDGRYVESLASGRHVELFPHNEAAYRAIELGFERHRVGAVVQATGTGKSFLLARYIAAHGSDRILVVAPNVTILNEIRRAAGEGELSGEEAKDEEAKSEEKTSAGASATLATEKASEGRGPGRIQYRTFQSLARGRSSGRKDWIPQADHILIDEFHHSGAEVWGEALREVIDANPSARVLGTSATPVRPEGMVDTVDVYFEGNLFYELTLPQAWFYGILPVPLLVQSAYGLTGELDKLQRALDRSECTAGRRNRIQQKLDAARVDFSGSLGASELIRRFLPSDVRKLLVFCRDKADLKQMLPQVMGWLRDAGRDAEAFEIHNDQRERENSRVLEAFRKEGDQLHVLFSINMLMEGLHVEGVDAALFLRRTESYVVTLQQLGRCLKAGSGRRPVILDLVNNLSGRSVYDVLGCDLERLSVLRSPHGFEGVSDFRVTGFFADIRQRVEEILADLEPWQVMYERLLDYRLTEDDWPSATDGKLGLWCHTQRMSKKRGTLSVERVEQLDAIGFAWEQQDSHWSLQYDRLKSFYVREGRWPKRGEGALGTWCNTQRQARKRGRLTKERIRRLDALGFIWDYDLDEQWHRQYVLLEAFVTTHDRFPKAAEGSLGSWCVTQRKMRRQGELEGERVRLLEALGFPWSAENVWTEHFNRLKAFHATEGRWPGSREGRLGSWCFVQKRLYRQGKLSDERVRKLQEIGFDLA